MWKPSALSREEKGRWPLTLPILDLNRRDSLILRDAFQNFAILGGIGSGKTSGPVQYVVRGLLRNGCGGLFLCVKEGAADHYRAWIEAENRSADLVEFSVSGEHAFNFLHHASMRQGDPHLVLDDVTYVLMGTFDRLSPRAAREDRFFRDAARELFRLANTALLAADGLIELDSLWRFLSSIPRDPNQARDEKLYANRKLYDAWKRAQRSGLASQMDRVLTFFRTDWPNYPAETRESIRATTQVMLSELAIDPLCTLFGKDTTVSPDHILGGGLVIVDIPLHVRERVGQIAAMIWKTTLQRATLARHGTLGGGQEESLIRPVFILGDEAHELVTPGDERFVSSSRELRGVTIYATQTINSLVDVLGEPATMSLLAGLRNRFVCRTDDPATANWFRDSVGQVINSGLPLGRDQWVTSDFSTDLVRRLKQGGTDKVVEAVASLGGNELDESGRRWGRVSFRQRIPMRRAEIGWQRWTENTALVLPVFGRKERGNGTTSV